MRSGTISSDFHQQKVYVYPEAIRAVMGSATNAALAALTANGNIRLTSDDVVIAE